MGTACCPTVWKHPDQPMRPTIHYEPDIPLDGPGSPAWDLRESQSQRARADAAESRLKDALELLDRLLQYTRQLGFWREEVQNARDFLREHKGNR